MTKQYRVINRDSRNEQIMNGDEYIQFTEINNELNYTVTPIKSNEQKQDSFVFSLALGCFSLAFILTATKIIMKWI
tara:strand:+ start:2333 stop:2560 length:228 start_codon:yes stop_codon:yes gene_type:complete